MRLNFYKYQGAGNDFILIDHRSPVDAIFNIDLVAKLCDRRFGIGADGLMLLKKHPSSDFEMIYFNADGKEGSMCGNGGRCIVAFAKYLKMIEHYTQFMAVDGVHEAKIEQEDYVELKMGEVSDWELIGQDCFLNTGSPHYIRFVGQVSKIDVFQEGRKVRYNDRFAKDGTNVNFVEILDHQHLRVATYERGVENETLACGTGVTAAALAYFWQKTEQKDGQYRIAIEVKGGKLEVRFDALDQKISNVWLAGPAQQVFKGTIEI